MAGTGERTSASIILAGRSSHEHAEGVSRRTPAGAHPGPRIGPSAADPRARGPAGGWRPTPGRCRPADPGAAAAGPRGPATRSARGSGPVGRRASACRRGRTEPVASRGVVRSGGRWFMARSVDGAEKVAPELRRGTRVGGVEHDLTQPRPGHHGGHPGLLVRPATTDLGSRPDRCHHDRHQPSHQPSTVGASPVNGWGTSRGRTRREHQPPVAGGRAHRTRAAGSARHARTLRSQPEPAVRGVRELAPRHLPGRRLGLDGRRVPRSARPRPPTGVAHGCSVPRSGSRSSGTAGACPATSCSTSTSTSGRGQLRGAGLAQGPDTSRAWPGPR